MSHTPVLLKEVLEILSPRPGSFIIDGTVDGGGHAEALLAAVGGKGKILGVDLDEEILGRTREKFAENKNVILVRGSYADLPDILLEQKLGAADGLLLDLGFSSEQLLSGRGFSFEKDEPLLMTYSDEDRPVKEWLRRLKESELADIIYKFGGERFSRRIARAIKSKKGIETSKELAEIIRKAMPGNYERGRINPATRTFQALRIFANNELSNLKQILGKLKEIVRPGARVAVIAFHSLEDKIVKEEFKRLKQAGEGEIITKKPIVASLAEVRENPRSRSAKLRAITIL
ncbi:MAG: 16S rRNA (cytosine(1402)-N(4))-methyltransferase RsmH [Candidatus Liptonbacteria bacterium]|nr:16S rRNA (cytosine(1402)-N(4))-methyltransferase RsmH [Candidatus Liptonbacteria bacterium]